MRVVVVSNRVAVPQEGRAAPGGLAVGVLAALRETGGLWFGWDGRIRERLPGRANLQRRENMQFATLPLRRPDYDSFYRGFSNRVLWPLCHYRVDEIEYDRGNWEGYCRVNELFTRRLLPLLDPDDLIWVHDYHCIPMASELRGAGVTQPIGFFLHIPFPPWDVFRVLPQHAAILRALTAYDLVGFQTNDDQRNFLQCMREGIGAKVDAEDGVQLGESRVHAKVFPIGIDVDEVVRQAHTSNTRHAAALRTSLGEKQLIIGVDRLDYSKGLLERFRAFEKLLELYPEARGWTVFMQIAQPSRGDVPEYQALRSQLEHLAGQINGRFGEFDWTPLRYLHKGFGRGTVLGFLAMSHLGLVTPLRDGMNLVAKEFIAAQDVADPGVLVLSEFTGAARELDSALQVNPYDVESVADAIARGVTMPLEERRERWAAAMAALRAHDITAWRSSYVEALRSAAVARHEAVAG